VSAAVVGLGGAPELGHVGFPIVGAGRISLPNVSEWKDTGKPLLRTLVGCDTSEEKSVLGNLCSSHVPNLCSQ
jgi:hypothetical protein